MAEFSAASGIVLKAKLGGAARVPGKRRRIPVDGFGNLAYDVVQMPPIHNLGEFEQVTLLAILRLGEEAYGVTIRREIADCTGRDPAPGALYTTLDRLEEKGLLTSEMSDPTPARGGRSKRYFTVTGEGVRAVANAQRAFQRMLQGLKLPGVSRA